MKKLIIGIVFVFAGAGLFAQNANDYLEVTRGVLKKEKKAAIAEVMQLTEEESTTFWPLYNEYNDKMYSINTRLFNAIMDYSDNYVNMTDEKAKELWTEVRTVRYFQAENKLKAMVDAELAIEIPLFEDMN